MYSSSYLGPVLPGTRYAKKRPRRMNEGLVSDNGNCEKPARERWYPGVRRTRLYLYAGSIEEMSELVVCVNAKKRSVPVFRYECVSAKEKETELKCNIADVSACVDSLQRVVRCSDVIFVSK